LPALVLLRKPLSRLAKRQLPRTLSDSFEKKKVSPHAYNGLEKPIEYASLD